MAPHSSLRGSSFGLCVISASSTLLLFISACGPNLPGDWQDLPRSGYSEDVGLRLDRPGDEEPLGYDVDGRFLVYWGGGVFIVDWERARTLQVDKDPSCRTAEVSGDTLVYLCWAQSNPTQKHGIPELRSYRVATGERRILASTTSLSDIEYVRRIELCENQLVFSARTRGDKRPKFLVVGIDDGHRRVLPTGTDSIRDFSCRHWIVVYDTIHSNGNIRLLNLRDGSSRDLAAHPAGQRRPRTDGRVVVYEDLRDDPGGRINTAAFDSNIYQVDLGGSEPVRVTGDPAIQLTPDVGSEWIVWQDFRNSRRPNFIGSKDQVDIYGRRVGGSEDMRLTRLPGVAFHPRSDRGRLFYRWRPPGERNAGIFAKSI